MTLPFPQLDVLHVSPTGAVELVAANVPYRNLQWTRRLSACGEWAATLDCDLPVAWPGRYLVTVTGRAEVGVVEKVTAEDGPQGAEPAMAGRFADCLWDRFHFPAGGASVSGANWRQAATRALSAWHMGDLPPLVLGAGTAAATGSSYVLGGAEGDSAAAVIHACCAGNDAYALVSYDRASDPDRLSLSIVTGTDRRRSQTANPWWVFSLGLGTISAVSYDGDYSVAASVVNALAERSGTGDGGDVRVVRDVAVPGFDAATQWRAQAFEDVGSLIGQDTVPTAANVDAAALLRAYDHMPQISVDASVAGVGYLDGWDLADTCEAEVPALGLVAEERVEEVREVWKPEGHTVEATLGTKTISRVQRALQGRR